MNFSLGLGNSENIVTLQDDDNDHVVMVLMWLRETYDVTTYHNLVRKIFLNLDPISLKRARLVCKEWDRLVMAEVWSSEEGRREMERRLDLQWRKAQPIRREVVVRPGYTVLNVKSVSYTHLTLPTNREV